MAKVLSSVRGGPLPSSIVRVPSALDGIAGTAERFEEIFRGESAQRRREGTGCGMVETTTRRPLVIQRSWTHGCAHQPRSAPGSERGNGRDSGKGRILFSH